MTWFLTAAQAVTNWVKKNWPWLRWVLFPIGILLLVLGWMRKTNITVLDSSLVDADKKRAELDEKALQERAEAAVERDKAVKGALEKADHDMAVVVNAQKQKAPALEKDEEALNKELLEIGKRQRS